MLQKRNADRSCPAIALTIAGSDSGGGAGIQADLHSFAAFRVHGTCAITAITAQNTRRVSAIHVLPAREVHAQIEAVLEDFSVGAIKIGMLATPATARAVASALANYPRISLILDPVLVATSGAKLARDGLVAALHKHLLARAELVTPNIPEAEHLLDRKIHTCEHMHAAARALLDRGARAVLLKGGHLEGRELCDLLLTPAGARWFRHARITGKYHGTGCSLSAAIAACIARGELLEVAVENGIAFVRDALMASYRPGKGTLRVLDHHTERRELRSASKFKDAR